MNAGSPTPSAQAAGPARLGLPRFVGRAAERALLTATLKEPPAVVVIEGEAGIGKSRLLHEALPALTAQGQRVLVGSCPPFREPFTLAPVVDALRSAFHRCEMPELADEVGVLRPLLPEFASHLPLSPGTLGDARAERHRLFRALEAALDAFGVTVLVVEDVHWADEATLELLLLLVCRRPQRTSVVLTVRQEQSDDDSALLRLMSRIASSPSAVHVALTPLPETDTASLVSSMLGGQAVSASLAAFLQRHTDGVPLLVQESVRLLHDRAELAYREGGWERTGHAGLHVPATVRDSVIERVRRLAPDAQRLLRVASVLGEASDVVTISDVAQESAERTAASLDEAIRSGLLRGAGQGRIRFAHAIAEQAVYENVRDLERVALHHRAGLALEQGRNPSPVRLARHFREAGDVDRWCHYAEQAAVIATGAGDDSQAIAILQPLLDEDRLGVADRARLGKQLGSITLSRRSSSPAHVEQVVRTLRSLLSAGGLDVRAEAELRDQLARLLAQQGLVDESRAEIERAIPHLDHDLAGAAKAMAYLGWPDVGPWPAAVHLDWLQRSAKLACDAMSPLDRLFLVVDRATALLLLGRDAGWDVARDIPETAPTAGERLQVARGFLNTGHCAVLWGRYGDARRRLDRGQQLARAEGSDRLCGMALVTLCHLDWLRGAWAGLPERVSALAADDAGLEPPHRLEARQVAALLRAVIGGDTEPVDHLRAVLASSADFGQGDLAMALAAALARELLGGGQAGAALDVTTPCVDLIGRKQVWMWGTDVVPVYVDALVATDRLWEARRLVRAFGDGLHECDAPAAQAALLWCRAAVAEAGGDPGRAAAGFGDAARLLRSLPRPYDALRADERQALALVASRHRGAGLRLLSSVGRALRELGASRDARRVVGLLQSIHDGRRIHDGDSTHDGVRSDGVSTLSPREIEAVRLVATGRTDREIAEAMFLSTNTVISHLASARRKLGVTTRTALAVAALEGGVVADPSE